MSLQNTMMVNTDDEECHRKDGDNMLAWEENKKTMKAKIFDWPDVMPITQDKDNKLWVVITF